MGLWGIRWVYNQMKLRFHWLTFTFYGWFESILESNVTRYRVIEPKIWLWERIVQYVQMGEWMFVVQYGENTVLFLCKATERFRANLFKDLWISEKTSKQFGLLSDNLNVKFLWIFCVTPWLLKIFSLIVNPHTEIFRGFNIHNNPTHLMCTLKPTNSV